MKKSKPAAKSANKPDKTERKYPDTKFPPRKKGK